MHRLKFFLTGLSLAVNQLVNAMTGGAPEMTVSARAGYARERGSKAGTAVCRVLEAMDVHPYSNEPGTDHCQFAIRNYEARMRAGAHHGR